ncbi:hypothetical protein ABBQ32_003911 [Trebouxia sp. C0010 RCD-2024]
MLPCRAANHADSEVQHATSSKQQQHDSGIVTADDSWNAVSKVRKNRQHKSVSIKKPDMPPSDWYNEPASRQDHATAGPVPWTVSPFSTLQSARARVDAVCNAQAGWDDSTADAAAAHATSIWDTDSRANSTWAGFRSGTVSCPMPARLRAWSSSTSHGPQDSYSRREQALAETDAVPRRSGLICHYCYQLGHIHTNCLALQADSAKPRSRNDFTMHRCRYCGQYGDIAKQRRGPGLIHHPELLSKPAHRNARSNPAPAVLHSAGSAATYPGARDPDVSSTQCQQYSDTHEPAPHAAPAVESQQSAHGAGSVPQLLSLGSDAHDEVKDSMSCGTNHDPFAKAVQEQQNGWDESIANAPLAALPPKPCPTSRTPYVPLPPKPSPSRRTPKITSHSAWQDDSQGTGPAPARCPAGACPAFPPGIIQPAMALPPSPDPGTEPTHTSPGHQAFTAHLSAPLPRPRPQTQQQSSPVSHGSPRGSLRRFTRSQPPARIRYEPPDQPASPASMPAWRQTQQSPVSSNVPAVKDDRRFLTAANQGFSAPSNNSASKPTAMQSRVDFNRPACHMLTPARAAAETARHASEDLTQDAVPCPASENLIHDGVPACPGTSNFTPAALLQGDDKSEEEAMAFAVQASLADEETQVPGNALVPTWLSAAQSGLASASAQQGTGLRNATGEYNCFLNVIIQCLWHCASFRHAVMQWPKAVYQDNEIASALVDLFQAFAQRAQGHSHQEVDPTLLRQALSRLPGGKFRVGE